MARRFISTEPPADVCKLGEKHDALGALDETPYAGKPVGAKERALLSDMSLWMEDPDHQRVRNGADVFFQAPARTVAQTAG